MSVSRFDIRAEYKDNQYVDFQVPAENLSDAKQKAEEVIRENHAEPIEWRGLVAFVGRAP